ncbi:Tn3 family transposase [Streptomyces sp. AK010]|uniref:Tn3 family transposase n=1 Tax=Streptomyces sp. AK010 TaxID=2723074 RepID=UPI0018128C52|nr:Tn3 family transposase [Streptomyces sp. AK010]MBB6421134.1 hypothetical protein [Streptomyces sp. AK010]
MVRRRSRDAQITGERRGLHEPGAPREIVRQLLDEGWTIEPEDLARISPYLTEHINWFGEYSTHELGIQPEAYETKLDVDFTQLRDENVTAEGLGQAA